MLGVLAGDFSRSIVSCAPAMFKAGAETTNGKEPTMAIQDRTCVEESCCEMDAGSQNRSGATQQVREVIGQGVSKAAEQARGYINERVSMGKETACAELGHAVTALRAGAEKLRGEQGERLAGYADAIADWAESGANHL